ncbi:hypothetical protein HCU64_07040 [Methylobacterium sp. C25]|uniref:GCG_CRPN prefix-to-repeats domain-containing protein n=1 Tax=Methylobacterium sp. C25 TaxID=2721622 RepID=UPI001F395F81|nr:hypothetical protein [Methylobacterium sp. C25]MCE4223502.1 hypothetical protein [Methylobacterium sp. C25]
MLKTFVAAPVLALGMAVSLAGPASALPIVNAVDTGGEAQIIQVYGGCGPMGHRGPYGGCRSGGQWGGYGRGRACPPGFHLGPYGRKCWPNRF